MSMMRDDHGQPIIRAFYQARANDRQLTELLGFAKGIVADRVVNDAECVALRQWMQANPDVTVNWPGNVVARRLIEIFEDGCIEDDEREDLRQLLVDLVGEPEDEDTTVNLSTRLAFDDPCPSILFENREFVFTGRFVYGTRKRCQQEVSARGGRCADTLTKRTNYLVVGLLGNDAWIQSTHGRKIEQAVEARTAGLPIAIVSERDWAEAIRYDA